MQFAPLTYDDLIFLLEVRNDCRDMLHDDRKFTLEECEQWFRTTRPDFRIIRRDVEPIGYFRLSNHDRGDASIYVGADLHSRFRGKGLGTEAYETFLPLVRDEFQVATFRLEVLSHNTVAIQLYQKLGFVESRRETASVVRHGAVVDNIFMEKPALTPSS